MCEKKDTQKKKENFNVICCDLENYSYLRNFSTFCRVTTTSFAVFLGIYVTNYIKMMHGSQVLPTHFSFQPQ